MESERKEHLLEPLTDTEGCTVPFGVHVRAIDLQLPPLPAVSQRHRAISAGSSDAVLISKLDPLDSDYESAWDFAKPGVDKLDGQYSAEIVSHSKPGDAIFATTPSERSAAGSSTAVWSTPDSSTITPSQTV